MYDTSAGRILWTLAYVGLGIFWSVVAVEQFGAAWDTALGGGDTLEGTHHVGVG